MIGNTNAAVVDLYREQVWNNPASYATNGPSDNFLQNAVKPTDPTTPAGLLVGTAYASQQTTDSWQSQLRQLVKQF